MFRINQKVVCVDDDFTDMNDEITPIKGEIYSIREIRHTKTGDGLVLNEIINRKHHYMVTGYFGECCFDVNAFRPVTYISDSQFIELEKELNKEEYAKI